MEIYFEVTCRLGKRIRTTKTHWSLISEVKHLEIAGQEGKVKETLIDPEIIRISEENTRVYLYYRRFGKYYLCVVARHLNDEGFIITCYFTKKIKEGEEIWRK